MQACFPPNCDYAARSVMTASTLARLGDGRQYNPKSQWGSWLVPSKNLLKTHGRTPLTRRRAPPARKIKRAAAPTAKTAKTRGDPASRLRDGGTTRCCRVGLERRWTPCEKKGRGGFWVDGARRVKDARRAQVMHSNMEC